MTVKELFRYLSQDQIVCISNSEHADTKFMEVQVRQVYGEVLGEVVERVFTTGDILHIYLTGQKPSTYLADCPYCHTSHPQMMQDPIGKLWQIRCMNCGLETGVAVNKEILADSWNTMCRRCKEEESHTFPHFIDTGFGGE